MLAQERSRAADFDTCVRVVDGGLRNTDRSHTGVRDLLHSSAGFHVRVIDNLFDIQHRRTQDAHLVQNGQWFIPRREGVQPFFEQLNQHQAVFSPVLVGIKARVVKPFGFMNGVHKRLPLVL